ncbi:hypothetical protein EON65_21205 [archaeon]|nr:MAG: hypothetical protein EON65_21205 [archaeon]
MRIAIYRVCAGHPVLTLIADEISEKLQQHQKAAQLLVLLSSQISSFLSPDNLISLSPTPQTDYSFSDVISLTGPGMLTQVIGQVLDNGCRSAVVEYGMLLLPAHILNPVPNAARVDLNTMSDLPCRDIREVDVSRFAADCSSVECLEQANYFAAVSRNDSSLVDWTDYAALKEMFVLKPETSRTVMAVHWWQRSWQ